MILRRLHLSTHPTVFRALTGLTVPLFDGLLQEVLPAYHRARAERLDRPDRRRALGGGDHFDLGPEDQLLLTIVWLRRYPTQEVLGFLFGVSDSTALRAIARCLPLLEQSGRDTMRMPDPGRGRRKTLPQLLAETPELAVIVDTFEQRIQRPRRQQRAYYSGKKKAHTLKSQVAVDEETGRVADVAESRPGRWADLKVLRRSQLKPRLPEGVGALGDLAYVGIADWHPEGLGATPRRKPRGQPRPEEDRRFNRAFARRRVVVEHTIGRMRRYQALSQVDRHRRRGHTARVRSVAGLVNRVLDHQSAA
jgi:DDE superfamily endonuclease/Helix-turn-helix of DDE superfamily endonuclease